MSLTSLLLSMTCLSACWNSFKFHTFLQVKHIENFAIHCHVQHSVPFITCEHNFPFADFWGNLFFAHQIWRNKFHLNRSSPVISTSNHTSSLKLNLSFHPLLVSSLYLWKCLWASCILSIALCLSLLGWAIPSHFKNYFVSRNNK